MILPGVDIGRHAVLKRCIVDKYAMRIPEGMVIRVDPRGRDRQPFHGQPQGHHPGHCRNARPGRSRRKLMADLAFLWHMHQPDYRHPDSGNSCCPWVFLHAIKDYTDMAAHLERHPGIRCTVNFVPVLLDQIEDYADQFASGQWRDPLLAIASASVCRTN